MMAGRVACTVLMLFWGRRGKKRRKEGGGGGEKGKELVQPASLSSLLALLNLKTDRKQTWEVDFLRPVVL